MNKKHLTLIHIVLGFQTLAALQYVLNAWRLILSIVKLAVFLPLFVLYAPFF